MKSKTASKGSMEREKKKAGHKKVEDLRIRKSVFLHQAEWDLLKSHCQGKETISKALSRILGKAIAQKQMNENLEALKRRHKPKYAVQVKGYQGEETGFTERQLDFIVEYLSRLYHNIGTMLLLCDSKKDQYKLQGLFRESVALEMVLEAFDCRVFSDRLERLKAPKGVDVEAITDMLIGD